MSMDGDENLDSEDVKNAAQAIGAIISASANSNHGKIAADNLGKSAVTITEAINILLLPISAIVKGKEKAKIYFDKRFRQDLETASQHIPNEHRVEPNEKVAFAVT